MTKQYSKLIRKFDIPTRFPDFEIEAGIYQNDEYSAFIIEVVDLRDGERQEYCQTFNSEWCDETRQQWIVEIHIMQMISTINAARDYQKNRVKAAYENFIKVVNT